MEGGSILMVDFPDLSNLNETSGVGGLLALPNSSYPYFWAWILFGIFSIMFLGLYFKEKSEKGKANILSSMAVSAFAILLLATIGTVVGFISLEIMVYILVISLVLIAIWFFSD